MTKCCKFPNAFRILQLFFLVLIIILYTFSDVMATSDDKTQKFSNIEYQKNATLLSSSLNKFSLDLFMALSKQKTGNLFFSPFSISAAVAMVYLGAAGNTENELKAVLKFPDDKEIIQRGFNELIKDYQKVVQEYQLRTSNTAYISDTFPIFEKFITQLQEVFLTTSKLVNFGDAEAVRQDINGAIEKATDSKITEIIPQGLLSELTALVLVNAIYFKGSWLYQFDPNLTEEKPFWITPDQSVNVPMMSIKKDFRVANLQNLDAELLALDYQGGRISFFIILPNQKDGLATMEKQIANEDFSLLDKKMNMQKTLISIPKFKLEESLDLVKTFQSMGIEDLFSPSSCDLSGLTEKKGLFVTNVLHKAFLEVNEEGSEAAAATVVLMGRSMGLKRPERQFVADHPFIFYIRDNASANVLFMGKYAAPGNVVK